MKASLVQLVERWSPKPNVVGSSPTRRVLNIFAEFLLKKLLLKCFKYYAININNIRIFE